MLRKKNDQSFANRRWLLGLSFLICCMFFQSITSAQKFSISFPIGSSVYRESESPLTVLVEGVNCDNVAIKSHQGSVSLGGHCAYIYRCKKIGLDTVEVFVRRGQKLQRIGEQVFEVKERPLAKAQIGGFGEGVVKKGAFLAQQGVGGSWFVGGNHWESCKIEAFNLIVLKDNKVVADIYNEGELYTDETQSALQKLEHGDRVLITNISGCSERGGGTLKTLEFTID